MLKLPCSAVPWLQIFTATGVTMGVSNMRLLEDVERRLYLRVMTYDELAISRLDLLRLIANSTYRDRSSRVAAAAGVAEIEAHIRLRVASGVGLHHQPRSGAERSEEHAVEYVAALTSEGDFDKLDTPKLMARRAALRERPDIVALVVHPDLITTTDEGTANFKNSRLSRCN